MDFQLMSYLIFVSIMIFGLIFRRMHIKNKCELIMTNANVIALDRQFVINVEVLQLLDVFIDDCFDSLIMVNVEYAKLPTVTSDQQKIINKKLCKVVSERISPSLVNKISIIYNKKYMDVVIAERCYLRVLSWAREINGKKYEDIDKEEDNTVDFNFTFEKE